MPNEPRSNDKIQIYEIIGTLGGVVGGLAAVLILHQTAIGSLDTDLFVAILGLLVAMLVLIFCERLRAQQTHEKALGLLQDILVSIHEGGHDHFLLVKLFRQRGRKLNVNEMSSIWKEVVMVANQSFWATSYISVADCNALYLEDGLCIHESRSLLKKDIRRIFIFNNPEEFDSYKEVLKKHHDHRIQIRVVLRGAMNSDAVLRSTMKDIGNENYVLDFGLSDQKWLFLWTLNDKRKLEHGEVLYKPGNVDLYHKFYDHLWDTSKIYDGTGANPLLKSNNGASNGPPGNGQSTPGTGS